jgi:hypothetical protein
MKTDKFNKMIEAFECDFNLALENKHSLSELDNRIKAKDEKILKDIDLLQELSYLLRYNKAEIRLIDDSDKNTLNPDIIDAVCILEAIGSGLTLRDESKKETACHTAIKCIDAIRNIQICIAKHENNDDLSDFINELKTCITI